MTAPANVTPLFAASRLRYNPRGKSVVFATYNGLLDPLGSSQILPYLERLHADWPVHILSFERPDRLADLDALRALELRLRGKSMRWTRLRYHKRPSLPATTFDLMNGIVQLRRILAQEDVGLIHSRSYLTTAIATRATSRVPILFDIRGLQAEEYVDGGVWKKGELKWRLAKRSERRFFERAAGAVCLSENIKPYVRAQFGLANRAVPIEVIPCCVDLERFRFDEDARARIRTQLGIDDATTLFVYSGTLGTWYLPDEMARFVRTYRDVTQTKVALLWMVNNDEARARSASRAAGLVDEEVRALSAAAKDVPGYLSAADAGLALITPSFSKRSSSPTKYAEYLAVGLPIVIHAGVGDGQVLADRGAAVALGYPADEEALRAGVRELVELRAKPRAHFRETASAVFDIESVALPAYRRLYRQLIDLKSSPL